MIDPLLLYPATFSSSGYRIRVSVPAQGGQISLRIPERYPANSGIAKLKHLFECC